LSGDTQDLKQQDLKEQDLNEQYLQIIGQEIGEERAARRERSEKREERGARSTQLLTCLLAEERGAAADMLTS
jgi:hypothetical protein